MDSKEIETIIALSQIAIAVAACIASIAIPIAIYKLGRKQAKAQFNKEIKAIWLAYDQLVLSEPNFPRTADSFMDPNSTSQTDDERTEKWLFLTFLNILETTHTGAINGLTYNSFETEKENIHGFLRNFITDDKFYRYLQDAYGRTDFGKLCKDYRLKYETETNSNQPADTTPAGTLR